MLRRIGVLASLAVVATMFAGVQSASAQTAGVCVFEGLAGTLDPAIENAVPDVLSLNPLDTEEGRYEYSGNTAVCAGVFEGNPDIGLDVSIDSNGFYDNVVCGTGVAHDLDGLDTTVSGTGLLGNSLNVTGAGYQIPFVGGVGPLLIGDGPALSNSLPEAPANHDDSANPETAGAASPDLTHGNATSDYTGLGLVQITPGQGLPTPTRDNCNTPAGIPPGGDGNTGSFEVKGFFVAAQD